MKHLSRILSVAIPVAAAGASTAFETPAVVHFLTAHPAVAVYVTIAAGALRAAWKNYRDHATGADVPAPPSDSSSMGAK